MSPRMYRIGLAICTICFAVTVTFFVLAPNVLAFTCMMAAMSSLGVQIAAGIRTN